MKLTTDLLDYCEGSLKWDEDLRQEVYVKILEAPDGTVINKGWLVRVYENLRTDKHRQDNNQLRLREENYDAIVQNLALTSPGDDPVDILTASEEIQERLDGLSPLLKTTLEAVVIEGMTPEDVAEEMDTTPNVIYKRIHDARHTLKGNN